jgi:hypothetical protein
LLKTNVNERFSQQEVIIFIKLFLSIIFNGFPVYHFPYVSFKFSGPLKTMDRGFTVLVIILSRIFCLPICYPKIQRLRYTEL